VIRRAVAWTHWGTWSVAGAIVILSATAVAAQGRGGGGGGGGSVQMPTRMALLTSTFGLDKAQAAAIKTILGEASQNASTTETRLALTLAHAAIGAAIQRGAAADAIDAAVKSYAEVSQRMADLELAALAAVVKSLNETQRGNAAGITSAVALMRGAFLDKKWDVTPGAKNY